MDGQSFSREVAFSQPVINIGAENGNDIVLKGNQVAEFHAMLHYDSSRWYITPLDANFKTSINSRVLDSGGANLQNGSVIEIGGHRLTMMLNGINTDIVIQSPASAEGLTEADMELSGQNILLNVTDMGQTELEAGVSTQLTLEVTNAGPLVANMQLQVQGIPSAWVQIIPPVLNLNEGRKGTFDVRISPPRDSSAEAGLYNLHFVALSPNYPRTTGVADTTLTILPYSEFLVSGPTPRQLKLSRGQKSDVTDLTVINNSNAAATFFIHSYDDANELNFAYPKSGGSVVQGQETVRIRAGDNVRVPIEVSAKKVPLIGFANRNHHYMASISPSDRPGDAQTVAGEVVVHPGIHTMWLFVILALIVLGNLFAFQPYIHSFTCIDGRQNQVIIAGNSAWLNWNISRYASTVTLDDGTTSTEITAVGNRYVNPTASTTYTITAENILSKFLNIQHTQTVQVLVIPQRPSISLFQTDIQDAIFDQPVKLSWSVSGNISSANLITNNAVQQLTPENFTSSLSQGLQTDTLFSLRAQNDNGYEMKSAFVNVRENRINLNRFTVWVRPNGIAVPSDNDVRRTTRWSSLQLFNTPQDPHVNPQPAPQSNTLEIPDNFTGVSYSSQGSNPELMAVSGQPMPSTGYTYESPAANSSQPELLVSPLLNPTAVPTVVPSPEPVTRTPLTVNSSNVPAASPEGSPSVNRDFSIKLMEVVEDPREDSGYRIIDYFPEYVLQKGEQILVDWNVDGVTQVKIENLSGDNLQNSGSEFIYPEKSITLTLTAESGNNKKVYTLPVRVAGDSDDGEGSGLNCELKANATTLKVPGAVMLTWSGGGTNRVQLVSSTQAEKENEEAEKKKEEEAKAAGQTYTKPTPGPLAGGTIGDWLQPSGFMRVNVDKQTTFMLNAYDGSGNVICTKSVEVKYEGGVDKKNVTLAITRIADSNDVVQPRFAVGQMVTYTVRLTDFEAGKQPTGNIMLTDGTSTCSMTLPVTSCSFQAKKAGALTVTAVYAGDDTYNKTQATARETVIDKLPTTTLIQSAFKPGAALADVVAQLKFDEATSYGLIPTGIMTFTIGSGTCDLDVVTEKLTCDGEVETDEKDSYKFLIKKMALADATADRIVASYKGDDYFRPSASTPVLFRKVPTTSVIQASPYKTGESTANVTSTLSWDGSAFPDYSPTGTITYTIGSGTCVLDLGTDKLSCESASVSMTESEGNYKLDITSMLLADKTADRIKADYSGDSLYNASSSTVVLFEKLPTTTKINNPMKYENRADLETALTYDTTKAHSLSPTGTITYTIIRPDPNHKETTCVLTLGANTLSCSGKVNYVTRYEITDMLFEDPESDRVKAVYSGDFFFNSSESPTVLFGEIIEEDIETHLNIDSAKKDPDGTIDLNLSLTWDETVAVGAKPGGTIKVTSGTGSCTLNLEASKPAFTDCQAESVTLDGSVYVIKNLQISGAGESIEAAYSGGGHFLPSTAAPVYFDRVDTATTILTAYKTNGNMPTLVTSLSWNTAEAQDEYPLGTITFKIGTDNCVLTLDNDEDAGKVKSFSCEGSDTVVGDGVLTKDGENSILTWTIERIALSAGNNADRVKASYSGDELFNASSSKEVIFETVETEIAITDQMKTPSGLVSLNLDLSWYEEPPVAGMRPTGLITLTSGTKNCTLDISEDPAKFTDCEFENVEPDMRDPKHSVYRITGLRMGSNSGTDIKAVYAGDGTFLTSTSQTKEFQKLNTKIVIDKAYKPDSTSLADILYHLKWDPEKSEGKIPTGTITLTIGSDVCKFDLETKKLTGCIGDGTSIPWDTTTDGDFVGDFKKLVISSTTADRVKVEYSGDSIFNPSSMIALFKMIPTNISITDAFKVDKDHANVEALLSWDENEAYGRKPTGTIKFVTGSSNCTLEISTGVLSCEPKKGTVSEDHKNYSVLNMLLDNNGVDRISVEYSGDSFFLPSVSSKVLFTTIPTTLVINEADVKSNGLVDLDLTLSWIDTPPAGLTPGKTIRLVAGTDSKSIDRTASTTTETSGSTAGADSTTDTNQTETQTTGAVCTLTIEKDSPIFTDCSGEVSVVVNDKSRTYKVTNLKFNSASVGSVKADYSGDGVFLSSTSNLMYFDKINTAITITDAVKSGDLVDLNTLLSWNKEEAEGKLPTGTITLTIGSDSCKLEFDDESAGRVKSFSCTEKDVTTVTPALSTVDPNEIITWTMVKVLLSQGSTADRVKVEYSGDSVFNASTSDFILFDISKKDTAIEITDANKSDNKITLTAKLTPAENETGTIVFTSGSATCTIDITDHSNVKFEKCSGTAEFKDDGTIEIRDMVMNGTPGDSIYAEYSGDSSYNKSTSPAFDFPAFEKIDTTLTIETADKTDGKITLTAKLTPEGDETGTVTFTSGSATCMLTIKAHNDVKFEKCSGTAEFKDDGTIEIKDMVMNGTPGDSIYAEYSGDSAYNKSTSPSYSFIKVDTKIAVSKAYKSDSIRAYFNTLLSWDKDEAKDKQPTGTVTFMIGESCKLTIDLEAGNKVKEFSCSDDKTEISLGTDTNGKFDWTFEKVLLTAGSTADRVKAEYSGDENFKPSTSEFVLFQTIPTMLDITDQSKSSDGAVNLTATLEWTDDPIEADKVPTGTIKLTMGSNTCTLNIGTPPSISGCKFALGGEVKPNVTPAKTLGYTITGLIMGDGSGDSIKAEYTGDGLFLASASTVKSFDKYNTELDIEKAYKSGTSYADLNTLLTWNKTEAGDKVPTGTITFTIGGDSCKLTFDNPKKEDEDGISYGHVKDFTCMEKGKTEITPDETPDSAPDTITWKIVNIMLSSGSTADRVKAEYSGDANFNPSTTEFVLFESIPTEMTITRFYMDGYEEDKEVLVQFQLGWTEEPSESDRVPSGTVTLTVGDKVCPLIILTETKESVKPSDVCGNSSITVVSQEEGAKYWEFQVRHIEVGTISKNSVIVEYSGDKLFQASKYEHKVDTQTIIDSAHINPNGTVDITFKHKWDQFLAGYVTDPNHPLYTSNPFGIRPSGTFKITVGASSCTLQLNGLNDPAFTDCDAGKASLVYTEEKFRNMYPYPQFEIEGLKIGGGTAASVKVEYSGDDLFLKSESDEVFFKHVDTTLTIDKESVYKPADSRVNLTSTLKWCKSGCDIDLTDEVKPGGTITYTMGGDACKLDLSNGSFTCADSSTLVVLGTTSQEIADDAAGVIWGEPEEEIDGSKTYRKWTFTFRNVLLSAGSTADRVKAEFSGDKLFNASTSDFVLFDTVPTTTLLLNQEKNPGGPVSALLELIWTKDPKAGDDPKGTIKLTSGSAVCTLDLAASPVRFTDCSGSVSTAKDDKKLTFTITNLNMGSGIGDDIKAEFSGSGSYLPSASIKKSFTKVNTALVINNAYKPNDPNYANLLSLLSWNNEKAAERVPTGTIKYTVGGGSCELNLSTKKLSCESASDPINMEKIEIDFNTAGFSAAIEKMLLADSSADRVSAEYSGDAVFNPSTASARLFKKLDTTIDITNAYRDKNSGRASVYARIDWDESEDEGLKPTGSLKFNLGSGSCTMDLKTKKLSCVGDTMGTISTDGHDYGASNLLLTDTDAKIVSVEYSGDGFFNSSVSQQKLFSGLKTTVAVTSASKGCDGENHCFINLSGTLDWEEDVSIIDLPTGKLIIKVGKKTIEFNMDDQTFKGVVAAGADYTSIANQVGSGYDPTNRHTFEFTNLLLDDVVNVNDITVEYSGDEYYGYSTGEGSISKITIETRIDLSLHDFHNNYQGIDEDVWRLRGAIKAANYELPFELTPTGSFTMKGYYEDSIYPDENRDFNKSDFQLDGPVYDLVNNFKVTLKWVSKPNGRYELKFNTGLSGCHEGDLRWVTIKYNGDNSDINFYKESNTATYYAEASNRLELEISKLYQTSYVDPDDQTSKEHFVKHLVLNYKGVNNAPFDSFRGTYTFVTNSGSCTLIHDYSGFTDSGTCKIGQKKGYHPTGETSGYLEIEKLELGNLSDTDLTVYFEGNEIYKPSQSAKTPIDRVETTLKLNPYVPSTPVIKNNLLEIDLGLLLTGGHPYLTDYTMPSPEGEMVIEVGDDYTCTMDFKREFYGGSTYYYVGTFREDCGSDLVKLETDFFHYRSSDMRFHIINIPVKDSSVSGFKVSYKGNSLYEASDFSYSFSGKAETTLTLEHNHDAPNLITTNITSPSTVGVPTGKVTYTFAPSGKTCTLSVTDTAHTGITVTNEDCPGGTIEGNPVIQNGNVRFILNKQNISGIEGDTMVTAYYNGDSQYSGSEGGTALQVRLIPVTEGLDSSGRLYFNTQDVSVSYPKYPERYSYSYCQQYPDDSTNCRLLEHKFTLTVRIETAAGAPAIPTGTKLQFAGEFYGSDPKQCSITPVSSGVYSCSLENIYFTTPGEKTISVSYPEAKYFYAEAVEFPKMYAVSVSSSGSIDTTTIITEPETLTAGTKVLVKADTFNAADPNDKPGEQFHLFYTYNFSTKERIETCLETAAAPDCELNLTTDTDWVYAEFVGYGTYAPSVASKRVDGASSGNALGAPVSFSGIEIGGGG